MDFQRTALRDAHLRWVSGDEELKSIDERTRRVFVDALEMFQLPCSLSGSFIAPSLPLFILKADIVTIPRNKSGERAHLNPALLLRGSLEIPFPNTLGNTKPQAPALPFTLLFDRCDSNFLLRGSDVVKRGTSRLVRRSGFPRSLNNTLPRVCGMRNRRFKRVGGSRKVSLALVFDLTYCHERGGMLDTKVTVPRTASRSTPECDLCRPTRYTEIHTKDHRYEDVGE